MISTLRTAFALTLVFHLALSGSGPLAAQDGEIIGGLLRDLIKSELERRQQSFQPIPPTRNELQQPPQANAFHQNVRSVRTHCRSFAEESATLLRALEKESRRHAGLHNHLDDVRKLEALASYVNQNLGTSPRQQEVINGLSQLDAQWRLAKYHLQQTPDLPSNCSRSIERLDQLNGQIISQFSIEPQFDRRELVRLLEALAAEIHHLERDVQYEIRSATQARQVLVQLQKMEARARLLSDAAFGGESYNEIVAEYNALAEAWGPISRQIYSLSDIHIDRTFEQIRRIDQGIREQLWLPQTLDVNHITYMTTSVAQQLRSTMGEVSLPMMLAVQDSQGIIRSASQLNRSIDELCECAVAGTTHHELVEHWKDLDASWNSFDRYLVQLDAPRLQESRQTTLVQLDDLRESVGIQLVFDQREVLSYAGEMDGIADQLLYHVGHWQRRAGASFPSQLARMANEFTAECRRFHDACARNQSQRQLSRQCATLVQSWQPLRSQLSRCNTVDRTAILRVADKSTTCLLHLQTLLEP